MGHRHFYNKLNKARMGGLFAVFSSFELFGVFFVCFLNRITISLLFCEHLFTAAGLHDFI